MFCAKCGKELDDNAQGCPYCGAVVLREKKAKKSKAKIVVVCGLVILILMGSCVAGMWYGSGGEQCIKLYYAKFKMNNGEYASALAELEQLAQLEDAKELVKECHYKLGKMFKNAEDYDTAIEEFSLAEDYLNAQQMKTVCENKKKQAEATPMPTPRPTQKPTPKPVVKEQTVPVIDPFETERYYYYTNSVIESTDLGVLEDYYISYGQVFAYEGSGQLILSYENGEEQNISFRYDNNGETNYPFSLSMEGDHLCVTTEEGNRLYFWEEKMAE